jgi:hypothetical protein
VRYLLIFPFYCSPLLSLYGYILSLLYMIVGFWAGGLTYIHLHLYPHMTSPTDSHSFPHLANFMAVVFGVGAIELCCCMFHDIHLALKTFVIYNSTRDMNSQASLYPCSQKFQSIYRYLPSPLPSCPSQCTLIMVLQVTSQHTSMKQVALTSKNPRGQLLLTRIKLPFTILQTTIVSFHTWPSFSTCSMIYILHPKIL